MLQSQLGEFLDKSAVVKSYSINECESGIRLIIKKNKCHAVTKTQLEILLTKYDELYTDLGEIIILHDCALFSKCGSTLKRLYMKEGQEIVIVEPDNQPSEEGQRRTHEKALKYAEPWNK